MKTLELSQISKLQGGNGTDQRAGWVCGTAIGLSVLVGAATGGIGMVAMLGGAAAPACGVAAGSLFFGK